MLDLTLIESRCGNQYSGMLYCPMIAHLKLTIKFDEYRQYYAADYGYSDGLKYPA